MSSSKNFTPPTSLPPPPPPVNGQVVSGSVSVPPATPAPAPAPKGVKAAAASASASTSTSTSSPAKRVCPVCKKKLGQGKKCPDHEVYCPGCGVVNEATEQKCHVCGTELNPPSPGRCRRSGCCRCFGSRRRGCRASRDPAADPDGHAAPASAADRSGHRPELPGLQKGHEGLRALRSARVPLRRLPEGQPP